MDLKQNKKFDKPQGGPYVGTIIDVVDMPNQNTQYGPQDKVRILWVIAHPNGAPYLDSENKPMTVAAFYPAKVSDKANLTKAIIQILNGPMPLLNNTGELAGILIGRSNALFITLEPDQKKAGEFFPKVAGISPMPAGVVPPQYPGFVREINKPKTQTGPNGQPVQTFQQRPATAPVNLNAGAPAAPVAQQGQNEAF